MDVGRDIVASLQNVAKCPCGYCHIADVESHEQVDHMESFFLAETVCIFPPSCLPRSCCSITVGQQYVIFHS